MADKPSTADIIRMIREAGGGSPEPAAESAPAEESQSAAPSAAGGGSPLDMIRASSSSVSESAGSAPAAGGSPLDMIRAGGGSKSAPAKPAVGGGSPLDMIRAGSGGGAASPSPGAAKSSPKKVAAKVPAGDLPPVKEMLEQMQKAKQAGAGSPLLAPVKPAKPVKPELRIPARPSKTVKSKETRRNFLVGMILSPFALAWTFLSLMTGVWTLAIARFMFPNVLVEPPSTFKIGPPSDYPLGTVSTKWTAKRGIWVIHTDEYRGKSLIYALASVCTHLGCTPSWLEGEQKFKCPCHGSGFYITGVNFEGPAPRPLERVGLRLAPDGSLEVDKSVKFQEEKGQWDDENSFVDASLV